MLNTYVQVYDCGELGWGPTHKVPIGLFLSYAMQRLSPTEILRLRDDLAACGWSRLDNAEGRWREYHLVSDATALPSRTAIRMPAPPEALCR